MRNITRYERMQSRPFTFATCRTRTTSTTRHSPWRHGSTDKPTCPSLRDAVRTVDRNLPLLDIRTQDEQIAASMQHERIFAALTIGFGLLALVLACIGIYGIMAYSVSQRTNEIGIRMALGAGRERVLRMVLGEASWITAVGVLAGLGSALALGRIVASLLYGIKSWDPATFAISATLLIAVAVGAS